MRTTTPTPPSGTPGDQWHARAPGEAAAALRVDPATGLTAEEVSRRLAEAGPNRLAAAPRRPAWLLFLDQFRNLLVAVLLGAAALAAVVGDLKDLVVIGAVLVLNAVLGFAQEHRAERSLQALEDMLAPVARVRRDGADVIVDAADLVAGDVVLLEAGDRVPADGRLLAAHAAEIDESALTGESAPVPKVATALAAAAPLAERANMAYLNTVVTRGRAEMLVTATGMATETGRLAGMLGAQRPGPTPLQVQLQRLGKRLALLAAAAVAVFFVLGLLRGQGLTETLMRSVALAVAAVPEGLPAVVTVTLAVGTHQLARRGTIVRRLASVETLGATTVICSDKTGTLTLNRMTATDVVADGAEARRRTLVAGALCNDARVNGDTVIGDPTETALLGLAAEADIDPAAEAKRRPRIAEIPFDPAAKFMATFHKDGDGVAVFAKGAPGVIAVRCGAVLGPAGPMPLDDAARARWHAADEEMAARGLRVLAVAVGGPDRVPASPGPDDVWDLTLAGLVGIVDPPRPEARDAVALCRQAGIAVKMITGDHAATATVIARDLGIPGDTVTGAELDTLDDAALAARMDGIGVLARVAPEHKVRVVNVLRSRGEIVAMTGDGVNDAPALKAADIGVAMGVAGTEVAREASSMVLTDDNFATIVSAVEGGRAIFDNIVQFVRFQLSTNLGAILSLVGAQVTGLPVPFTAVQVLWVNLIMDGPPAMALGVDPADEDTMTRPPRNPREGILTGGRLARMLVSGAVMASGTLAVLWWALGRLPRGEALTLAFTTFVLFQVLNVFNVRTEEASVFGRHTLRNWRLWAAVSAVVVLQVLTVEVGALRGIFGTTPLGARHWLVAGAAGAAAAWVEEVRKRLDPHPSRGPGPGAGAPPARARSSPVLTPP